MSWFFWLRSVGELVEEEVLKTFLKERQLSGDFISKASDVLWQREALKLVEPDVGMLPDSPQEPDQVQSRLYIIFFFACDWV